MATHPKQTHEGVIAEARLVAAMARMHFDGFQAADAKRKKKFLPESRLLAFEAAIKQLVEEVGRRTVAANRQLGATLAEGRRRSRLYDVLRELREEVKLGLPEDPAMGRAFGVGVRMSRNSTPRVLVVAQGVLASWALEELREAVMKIGVTGARMEEVRELTVGLGKACAEQDRRCGVARGRTLAKDAQLGAVQREMVYVRQVARLVFRKQPAVLVEFESTVSRGGRRRRGARAAAGEGDEKGAVARGAQGSSQGRRGGVGLSSVAARGAQGEEGDQRGQEGGSLRQVGSSGRQEGSFAGQSGSSGRQEGSFARQEGSFAGQSGSSGRQEGSFAGQSGSSLRQDGSSSKKDGSFPREQSRSGRVRGAAPRMRKRRRR